MNKSIYIFLALVILNVVSAQFGEGEGSVTSSLVASRCNPRCRNGGQCVSDGASPPVFSCKCNLGFSGSSCTTLTNFCTTSTAANVPTGTDVCLASTSLQTCLPITARNALGVLPGYVCVPTNIVATKSRCLSSGKQSDGSNLVQVQCSARQ